MQEDLRQGGSRPNALLECFILKLHPYQDPETVGFNLGVVREQLGISSVL
jgi:hypothetical protein